MKRFFSFCLVLGVGVAMGRLLDLVPSEVEAGGGKLPTCQDINGDGSINLTDAVFLLNWLFRGGPEPSCPAGNGQPARLPDTGQSKCFDQAGEEIPCDSATCSGQDGIYTTGCPAAGRFTDNGDGTVTDDCTGLMWQKQTADVNGDGQSTIQDFVPLCDALTYCENLSLGGNDDWRLPNVRELQSIVDYGRGAPAIDPAFGVVSSGYWTSTSYALIPAQAWLVDFLGCVVHVDRMGVDSFFVRAVRNAP